MARVLYTDPWDPVEDKGLREQHAQLCLEQLRKADKPMTSAELFYEVNRDSGSGRPVFGDPRYVMMLMEHLRRQRFVYGQANKAFKPDRHKSSYQTLSAGHPEHPRLYTLHKYQAAEVILTLNPKPSYVLYTCSTPPI